MDMYQNVHETLVASALLVTRGTKTTTLAFHVSVYFSQNQQQRNNYMGETKEGR